VIGDGAQDAAGPDPSPYADGSVYNKLPCTNKFFTMNYICAPAVALLQEPVFKTKGFNKKDLVVPDSVTNVLSEAQFEAVRILNGPNKAHVLPGKVSIT
jgi:hypothetical protein